MAGGMATALGGHDPNRVDVVYAKPWAGCPIRMGLGFAAPSGRCSSPRAWPGEERHSPCWEPRRGEGMEGPPIALPGLSMHSRTLATPGCTRGYGRGPRRGREGGWHSHRSGWGSGWGWGWGSRALCGERVGQEGELVARNNERVAQNGERIAQHGERFAQNNERIAQHGERVAQNNERVAQHGDRFALHNGRFTPRSEGAPVIGASYTPENAGGAGKTGVFGRVAWAGWTPATCAPTDSTSNTCANGRPPGRS